MKFNRAQNAARNIFFGLVLKIYQLIVPFVMRTVMIYYMGMQYLGLNSLFTSVLSVLNLAELGVGSAMVYSMYQPIAEDDRDTIRSLMRLYRTYYRIIGLVIAVAGTILTPFIPHLIHGSVPAGMNVYTLYLLNLAATVLSYWLFAYKNSILDAYQRTDVVSKATLISNTIMYILQAWTIMGLHNYYAYVIMSLFGQLLNNVFTAIAATKMFPDMSPGEPLAKEQVKKINRRIRDLFTSKLGAVIVGPTDTLVISAFLGLTMLAKYQNYFYIITALTGIVGIVYSSVTAGIGNSLMTESEEKNVGDLAKFTFIMSWIAGFCSACLLNLYQPFMELWVGKQNQLSYRVVICLAIYFYVVEINTLMNTFKDAGGLWRQDRFRPLVTGIVNVGLNLATVKFWGVYGVVLSTVLSMAFVGMPWLLHNLFTTVFAGKHFKIYFRKLVFNVVVTVIACTISVVICAFIKLTLVPTIVLRLLICLIVPNLIYLVAFYRQAEFLQALNLVNSMTGYRISLISRMINKLQ